MPFPFFEAHDAYVRVEIRAAYHEQFERWHGWVESKCGLHVGVT